MYEIITLINHTGSPVNQNIIGKDNNMIDYTRVVSTPEQYKHNLDMLHSLINSKVCSTQVLRLIQMRTHMAHDDIQSMQNYADKNTLSPVYTRILDKVNQMTRDLQIALMKG